MRNRSFGMLLGAFLLAASFGSAAQAQDRSGERPERSCALDCRYEYRTCIEMVRDDLRLCRSACDDVVTAAREACADDRSSEACGEARAVAAACLRPCHSAVGDAVGACRTDLRACIGLCPVAEPLPPVDPECATGCREENRACQAQVDTALEECAATCSDLIAEAREACAENPRDAACRRARQDAADCLNPCRREAIADRAECLRAGKACAASCAETDE